MKVCIVLVLLKIKIKKTRNHVSLISINVQSYDTFPENNSFSLKYSSGHELVIQLTL